MTVGSEALERSLLQLFSEHMPLRSDSAFRRSEERTVLFGNIGEY